jgi:predicted RecA/RadA family phage recombinase
MARNFIHPGETITVLAPYPVASGAGLLSGAIFAVALAAAAQGAPVEARRIGVWDLPKATGQAWVADTTKLYWDNTARNVTSTAGGNTFIGVARQSQAAGDVVGRVLLTGQVA